MYPQETPPSRRDLGAHSTFKIRSLNFDLWRRIKAIGPHVEYIKGEAVFDAAPSLQSPYSLSVGDLSFNSNAVVISTGSTPRRLPEFKDDPRVLTSDDLFWRQEPLGASVAVVGGGYIALESASVLHALCHNVTVYLEEPLRSMDRQCARMIMQLLEEEGIKFVNQSPHRVTLSQFGAFDNIMLAIGRTPNIPRWLPSSIPSIYDEKRPHFYALGDVVENHRSEER